MSSTSVLQRLGDTAHSYAKGLKSLTPSDSDVQGMREVQKNVDQAVQKPTPEPARVGGSELLHPLSKYGDRPGEKRPEEVLKDIKPLPSYQEGGTVPEDQVAKLHEGEEVLPPEEAEQYRREHPEKEEGAPVGFPGMVLPNPKGIEPVLDTDIKPETEKITGGAKMNTDNAPAKTPEGNVSNPEKVNMSASGTEISTKEAPKAKPFGQLVDEQAEQKATEKTAAAQAAQPPMAVPEEKPKMTGGHLLADEWLKRNVLPSIKLPEEKTERPTYGGPGKPVAQGEAVPAKQLKQDEYKYNVQQLQKQHQDALAAFAKTGDPRDQLRADATSRALMEYQKANPWGSAANHPGIGGKIAHYGSLIGNIAGDVAIPSVMMNIPGTDLNKKVQAQGVEKRIETEVPEVTKREAAEKETEGKPLTNPEATYKDLMTGGPNGGPKPNPDTGAPFTAQEANVASQGTGKTPEELYVQDQMRGIDPATGKHFTRQQAEERYLQMKAGTKPANEEEKRVNDYIASRGQTDTPANREAARTALKASDTVATQQAALPFAEQKAKFNDVLNTTRSLLVQQNADANQRGLKADELQNTENTRSAGVITKLTTAKDALNATDEQFSNQIVPVVTLLAVTSAEGAKRVNKQELDKFVPTSGSLGRWIEGHVDQFLSGQIPAEYRTEVGHMLDRMEAAEDVEHKINTQSIDNTVRQGAQQPVQKKTGGAQAKPAPSKPQGTPTATANKYHMAGAKGEIVSNDGKTWYDLQGKQVGK